MNINLELYSYSDLRKISIDLGLEPKSTKKGIIADLKRIIRSSESHFGEYKTPQDISRSPLQRKKGCNYIGKYIVISQLGTRGKEGTTYKVKLQNKEYAMKTFKKNKSVRALEREVLLQIRASREGAAPEVVDYDTNLRYIVMPIMDTNLVEILRKQKNILKVAQQRQIISIFKKLDSAKVFHADSNFLNYMFLGDRLYMIDYGMSKEITNTLIDKLGTETPNLHIMTLGLVVKLKDMGLASQSYSYLIRYLSKQQREEFHLD